MKKILVLEDESNIDGYMLQKRVGYTYTDIAYIPKSGADIYSHVHKDLTAETTYNYAVRICLKDGDTYFKGNPGYGIFSSVGQHCRFWLQYGPRKSVCPD